MVFLAKIIVTITKSCFQKNIEINNINMPYYDRIDVPEDIDINKTIASKEYIICHYRYFLGKGFKF